MAVVQICVHCLYELMVISCLLANQHAIDKFKAAASILMECLIFEYVALNHD